jgi:hypothetical protein
MGDFDVLRKNGHHNHPLGAGALQNITGQISLATSGQPLVRAAKPAPLELIAEQ